MTPYMCGGMRISARMVKPSKTEIKTHCLHSTHLPEYFTLSLSILLDEVGSFDVHTGEEIHVCNFSV